MKEKTKTKPKENVKSQKAETKKTKEDVKKPKRLIKKVCIIFIVSVLVYTAMSMIGSVIIFNIIFSRSANIEAFELTYQDVDSSAYPREEVYFMSGGNKLYGCVYKPEKSSQGLILLANGMNCCIDRHLPEIMYFVDNGFTVMTYENTGVDKSEGGGTVGIAQARLDADSAIDYISKDSELSRLPLVMYGHSLGAYASATVLNDKKEVRAVVCVAGFNSPNENMLHFAKKYVGAFADLQYPFMCLQNFFLFGTIADDTAINAINSTKVPVMVIGGNSDDTVPDEISILNRKGEITNPNAEIVEITEPYRGEHSTAWLSAESAKYLEETKDPDDKELANILDEDYMKNVVDFYKRSISSEAVA